MSVEEINDKKALKSGIWYILCNFLVKGAVFLSTPLFTRMMSVEDIGNFSNVTAWVNILMIITSLELASSITFAHFDYKNELNEFVASILVLSSTVTLIMYIIVIIFRDYFMSLFSVDYFTLHIIFLYCLFCPALQMIQVKNRVLFEYKFSSVLSFISVFLSIGVSLIFVILFSNKLSARISGYYGSLIAFNIILYIYILLKSKKISTKYWKYALTMSIPMIIHILAGQLLSSCDRMMITKISGSSQNAMYSVAYTCATVISVLWTSLNTAWSPWAYEQMNRKTYIRLTKASKPYIILFLTIVIFFLLIAPELLLFMGGKKYLEAVYVLPPVVIGIVFQFIYSLYVNIEFFYKKQKYTAIGTLIAALINIVLNYIFIPKFGYIAAAYTTLIGYIVLFSIHYSIVVKMGKSSWYDTRFNFLILGGSLMSVPLFNLLYMNNMFRWILIALLGCVILVWMISHRRLIKEIIDSRSLKSVFNKIR